MAQNTRSGAVRLVDDVRPDETARSFLPGMGKPWLLPLYDPFTWLVGGRRLYRRTASLAGVSAGDRVLDVGCGTGNLAFAILRATPSAVVTGLDPDLDALRRTARKARRRRVPLTLVRGYADRLPVPDASQDHVVSSLALHHVPREDKERFAAELVRVLRPGGRVTIADLDGHGGQHGHGHDGGHDGAQDHGSHRHGGRKHRVHEPGSQGFREDNADGGIERLLTAAGLEEAREVDRTTVMGAEVLFVQARRP
jgi:SAM-dependent methyltransferase